jgi:hypothetical protein
MLVNEVGAKFLFESGCHRDQRSHPVRLFGLRRAHPCLVTLDKRCYLAKERNRGPGKAKADKKNVMMAIYDLFLLKNECVP